MTKKQTKKTSEEKVEKKPVKKTTKVETKEVKKETKKEVKVEVKKENKFKKVLSKIKNFFNNPVPLIIALIIITCLLLFYISKLNGSNEILVGEINESDIQVGNIHYFNNNSMNYFYADKATYSGTETDKVYNYQIGYFVMDNDGELQELASRSGSVDEGTDLAKLINDMSGWNFGESARSPYFFTKDVTPYLHDLYFVVRASTSADSNDADIEISYAVNITDIS